MTPVLELNMNDPKQVKALRKLLRSIASGQLVANIKQAIKKRNSGEEYNEYEEYDFRDIQTALTDVGVGATVEIRAELNLAYIRVRNLKNHNVKQLQTMWQTVLHRGTARFLENEPENDYILTLDCLYVSDSEQKSYLFGCNETPIFCSSDGDDDLMFVVDLRNCFVSTDRWNAQDQREAEYYAAKAMEEENARGENSTFMAMTEENYDKEPEDTAPMHDALNLDFINGVVRDGEESEEENG